MMLVCELYCHGVQSSSHLYRHWRYPQFLRLDLYDPEFPPDPPPTILPALHQRSHKTYIANDGTESGFSDDMGSLRGYGKRNKETIGDLLFHFFRFYAHELEYDTSV